MKELLKIRTLFVATALALSGGLVSCDDDDNPDRRMDNQMFVSEASSSNMLEIEAGRLAVSKGQREAVRMYGQHMVEDHTAVGTEMKNLAPQKGWTVPTELLQKHRNQLADLQAATTNEFDRKFAQLMVDSHEEAVDLFSDAAENDDGVADVDLRNFAASKLPALRRHLEEAKELREDVQD
jgi:putative membrane protein